MIVSKIFVTVQSPNFDEEGNPHIFDTRLKVAYKQGENIKLICQAVIDRFMKGARVLDAFEPELDPDMF